MHQSATTMPRKQAVKLRTILNMTNATRIAYMVPSVVARTTRQNVQVVVLPKTLNGMR